MQQLGIIAYKVPILPMRYARHFSRFMESQGINTAALLEGTLITKDRLLDSDGFLSMTEILSILNKAQKLLDDELAPFEFGRSLDIVKHGLLGHSLLCQHDIKQLLNTNIAYLRVCLPLMDIQFHQNGTQFSIQLEDSWDLGNLRTFIVKIYLGSIYALTSLVCRNLSFTFDFPTTLSNDEWQKLLRNAPIRFGAEKNIVSMIISNPRMSKEQDEDNIANHLAIAKSKQNLELESTINVLVRVRQKITNDPGRDSTLERVAHQLGMCTRSVRRHLKMAGFSFQDIRNEVRETFATRYLTDTSLPLEKIAERLGYSDQASFTKAYRGWTGKTPGIVRRSSTASV